MTIDGTKVQERIENVTRFQNEIRELKNKIRSLEYKFRFNWRIVKVSERYEFLSAQKKDW